MRIPRADLQVGDRLGAGSQGVIYRVRKGQDLGLPFEALIYKEFSAGTAVSGAALEHLSRFRDGLDDPGRRLIDAMTVWPLAVVEDGGRPVGYLMQEIPPPFLQPIATMAGAETIPREVQHLFVSDALARRTLGETANRLERLALARELAFVLGFLHRKELVFGDLSYRNTVYTLRPRPTVMLLDCDAVRARGQGSAVAQLHSPGWAPPEKGPQTIATDRFKLGLFVLRVLTPGVNAQNRDPAKAEGVLDAEGMGLLRRALDADPASRTSGREWVEYLDKAIARAGGLKPRTGWVPRPEPPARRARPGELAPPRRTGVPMAAAVAVTAPARPARFVTPALTPPPGGAPPPHRVRPGHVRSFRGAGAAGVASGVHTPPPTANLTSLAYWGGVGVWGLVIGVLLFLFIGSLLLNASRSPSSPTGAATGPTGTLAGARPTIPIAPIGEAVDTAVRQARSGTTPGYVPISVGTRNPYSSLRVASAVPLSRVPDTWRVVMAPADRLEGTGSIATEDVRLVAGTIYAAPLTIDREPGAPYRVVPLPGDIGARATRAVATAGKVIGADAPVDYAWVCPPVPAGPEDCRWLFADLTGGSTVTVAADGTRVTDGVGWAGIMPDGGLAELEEPSTTTSNVPPP